MLGRGDSRSGLPILFHDGKPLHSTYDPVREACRFAQAQAARLPSASVLILVGAAMGYVESALAAGNPGARLLRVFLDREVAAIASGAHPSPCWQPGNTESLSSFLAARLDESDALGLRVVEWAPCVAAFAAEARRAGLEIRAFVQRLKANYATTAAYGPLWLRNAVVNSVHLPALVPWSPAHDPVLIAASGPSLADVLPAIARGRDRLTLWALPSALRPLGHARLEPDLVVATDAGLYALRHLDRALRVPIAMPLSASRGAWRFTDRVQLFVQPYLFEKDLASLLAPWSLPVIAPQGTVAASALLLALALGHKTIIFAGLDFCYRDVLSHARPSLAEAYYDSAAGRLSPFDGALYASAAQAAATSAALQAYASWFAAAPLPADAHVFRLLPSRVHLPALEPLDAEGLAALLPLARHRRPSPRPVTPQTDRAAATLAVTERWLGQLAAGRGRPPASWPEPTRELCFFLELDAYARSKSAPRADEVLERAGARIAALRARLADGARRDGA